MSYRWLYAEDQSMQSMLCTSNSNVSRARVHQSIAGQIRTFYHLHVAYNRRNQFVIFTYSKIMIREFDFVLHVHYQWALPFVIGYDMKLPGLVR